MPSLWDSFSGAGAAKAARRSEAEAASHLGNGLATATGNLNTGYSNAMSRINPYMQGGQGAYNLYNDFMGVNGRPAQTNAMGNFQSSPYMSYLQSQGQRAVDRRANASGGYYSGNALSEASRVNQGIASQDYNQYLAQLAQLGQQGQQMGQFGANLDFQHGNTLAGLNYGNAQQLAGNAINRGNAEAQASGALWNNILGLGSMGIGAYNAFNPVGKPGGVKTNPMNNFSIDNSWGSMGIGAYNAFNPVGKPGGVKTNPMNNFSIDNSWQGYGMGVR